MLVLDNKEDQNFLEKVLVRLRYTVIAMRQGVDLSEQLIDHFPDVVFASTLGQNPKILSALGKIKEVRGKPKLVFVRQEKESVSLTAEQKRIIDGVLYSPVDPFKLIDLLASTTEVPIVELRRRYNEMLEKDRDSSPTPAKAGGLSSEEEESGPGHTVNPGDIKNTKDDHGNTHVFGSGMQAAEEPISVTGDAHGKVINPSNKKGAPSSLIHDEKRKSKYAEIEARLKKENDPNRPKAVDVQKLRDSQRKQSEEVAESPTVKQNRKHFLKTLFSVSPADVNKKNG